MSNNFIYKNKQKNPMYSTVHKLIIIGVTPQDCAPPLPAQPMWKAERSQVSDWLELSNK